MNYIDMNVFFSKTLLAIFSAILLNTLTQSSLTRKEDKTKCPKVKAIRNFDLEGVSMYQLKLFDHAEFMRYSSSTIGT